MLCGTVLILTGMAILTGSRVAAAADWHVNVVSGNDDNPGQTADDAFRTIQKAVNLCAEGDTIHLHPKDAVARQMIKISGKSNFNIEGNGVTIDASDPLPEDGWETVSDGLYRRKLPKTVWDRHLLIIDGKMERMGRTQSSNSPPFPAVEDLQPGQFCFENIGETEEGWLYVHGSTKKLCWSIRPNCVATSGEVKGVTIRNLNTRYALNDGFNIHGNCTGMVFENVTGYDCFDEGFSAHGTCECRIVNGKFWGNENGIADVNEAITVYEKCEFRDSVNTDVLLWGKRHELIDCKIINTTTAAALVAGPRAEEQKDFEVKLSRVSIDGKNAEKRARIRVNGGKLEIRDSVFANVDFVPLGAEVTAENLTVNGESR